MTPEEIAKTYIEKNSGPVLFNKYLEYCKDTDNEPVEYLKFFKIMFQAMGAIQ